MTTRLGPLLLLSLALPAGAAQKPQISVEEWTLPNGMRWLLYEHHDSPTVSGGWGARVGSGNERPGITGISHFFEHMMFKGTRVIGTKDIDADLKLIDEQEKVAEERRAERAVMRAKLRRGEIDDLAKPESWTPRYKELAARFDALVEKQRDTIIKDHFTLLYTTKAGALVLEGRRMRPDSPPLGKFDEDFNGVFWEASPYQWPTVGWPSDIPTY